MKTKLPFKFSLTKLPLILFIVAILAFLLLFGIFLYRSNIPVLDPKGWVGIQERDLLVIATLLMLIVVIPVFIMAVGFARTYRSGNHKAEYLPDWDNSYIAEAVWWGIPCIIILILGVLTYTSSHQLDPYRPLTTSDHPPMKVQVVALPWKWLFIYPEQRIASVNYFQIPERRPILFEITADAPMNSFWIPQLGGQIFAMPGMKTKLHLIAHEQGSYAGASANLSGTGFSGMSFTVQSTAQSEFDAWAAHIRKSSGPLSLQEYLALAQPSENNPVSTYALRDEEIEGGLFDWIFMKFMMPMKDGGMNCHSGE